MNSYLFEFAHQRKKGYVLRCPVTHLLTFILDLEKYDTIQDRIEKEIKKSSDNYENILKIKIFNKFDNFLTLYVSM